MNKLRYILCFSGAFIFTACNTNTSKPLETTIETSTEIVLETKPEINRDTLQF